MNAVGVSANKPAASEKDEFDSGSEKSEVLRVIVSLAGLNPVAEYTYRSRNAPKDADYDPNDINDSITSKSIDIISSVDTAFVSHTQQLQLINGTFCFIGIVSLVVSLSMIGGAQFHSIILPILICSLVCILIYIISAIVIYYHALPQCDQIFENMADELISQLDAEFGEQSGYLSKSGLVSKVEIEQMIMNQCDELLFDTQDMTECVRYGVYSMMILSCFAPLFVFAMQPCLLRCKPLKRTKIHIVFRNDNDGSIALNTANENENENESVSVMIEEEEKEEEEKDEHTPLNLDFTSLKHSYFVMIATQCKGRLSTLNSDVSESERFPLVDKGEAQAKVSGIIVSNLMKELECDSIQLYHSPLLRTKQTAMIVHSQIESEMILKDESSLLLPISMEELAERKFGELDGTDKWDTLENEVWKRDNQDESSVLYGCESIKSMKSRITSALQLCEDDEKLGSKQSSMIVMITHREIAEMMVDLFESNHHPSLSDAKGTAHKHKGRGWIRIGEVMPLNVECKSLISKGVSLDTQSLRNDWYVCRHGESLKNVEGIISSDPQQSYAYPLTEKGEQQARDAGQSVLALMDELGYDEIHVYNSPLLRAKQTAELIVETVIKNGKRAKITEEREIRERDFGELDGTKQVSTIFHELWTSDARDDTSAPYGCASMEDVKGRVKELVLRIEGELASPDEPDKRHLVLLVSHGDTSELTDCLFEGRRYLYPGVLQTGHLIKLTR